MLLCCTEPRYAATNRYAMCGTALCAMRRYWAMLRCYGAVRSAVLSGAMLLQTAMRCVVLRYAMCGTERCYVLRGAGMADSRSRR
eukprot:942131-Rhodomonas_salina.1